MRKLFALLLALICFNAQAQVTFKITAVPANTPANATFYIAGTFNGWNPSSAAHALTHFYFVSGTTESATMVPQMQDLRDSLQRGGVPTVNLSFNTRADGQHADWFWKREFPAGYSWLYAPATATAARPA